MKNINAKNISLEGTKSAKEKFCELWPAAKIGLEALSAIVKNPIAKATIETLIKAGDALAKSICG